jgi:hypothetical protein
MAPEAPVLVFSSNDASTFSLISPLDGFSQPCLLTPLSPLDCAAAEKFEARTVIDIADLWAD